MDERKKNLEMTWPLYKEDPTRRFPEDSHHTLGSYTPSEGVLSDLSRRTEVPESTGQEAQVARKLRESMPPSAPDWMRAAQALVTELNGLLSRPEAVSHAEVNAVARIWAAWSLGGASEAHVLRVAHLITRAHTALRERPDSDAERAYMAAARVLHTGLPSALRASMPLERALFVVRTIDREPDPWAAVVGGTAELLGWTDYARIHAASVIRAVIERDYQNRHVSG